MTTLAADTIPDARKKAALEKMKLIFVTAPLPQHYFARVAYQSLDAAGLALRVDAAFGFGQLYTMKDDEFTFLPDPTIPSRIVREALQTSALDRIVSESIQTESALVADRHLSGRMPVPPELKYIPQGCLARDVQEAYVAILNAVLETPGYRDQVSAEMLELF